MKIPPYLTLPAFTDRCDTGVLWHIVIPGTG